MNTPNQSQPEIELTDEQLASIFGGSARDNHGRDRDWNDHRDRDWDDRRWHRGWDDCRWR
jgi:hypothetical protein